MGLAKNLEDFKVDGKVSTESGWLFLEWFGAIRREKRGSGYENIIISAEKYHQGTDEIEKWYKIQFAKKKQIEAYESMAKEII